MLFFLLSVIIIDSRQFQINHMKHFAGKIIILSLFIYLPLQSMAWGLIGHRVVGEIAEYYLTSSTKKKIRQILGNESLAISSNWADFIKSDTAYRYLNNWHFVNFDSAISYQQMQNYLATDTSIDAYTKLTFMLAEMKKKNLPQAQKLMYLRLIIHIVGDLHQPLHAAANGTRGGNQVRVLWFNEPSNLHRVWDEHLVEYQQLSYTELTRSINFISIEERKRLQSQPISEWLYESYSISNKLLEEIKQPNQKLSFEYNFKHHQTMNEQLLKGGVRLAGILNELFKSI